MQTVAINPLFTQRHKLIEAMLKWKQAKLKQWVNNPNTDLATQGMPQIIPANLPKDKDVPRVVHVDLSLSQDRCGIALIKVGPSEIVENDAGTQELMPTFIVEMAISIQPTSDKKIDITDVRRWIMQLVEHHGVNIHYVSYDGFQSAESLAMFRKAGIRAFEISVDKTTEPYEVLRDAYYDGRITQCPNEVLTLELSTLEKNDAKNKIDHRPKGCFTGDTRIALLDGSVPTFEELALRYPDGDKFPVFSMNDAGLCVGWAHHPRITRKNAPLVEVLLDNFQVIRCTPDHLFMTRHGEWIQAQHLTPDVSLMPLYRTRYSTGGWAGYEHCWCPIRKLTEATHHMVARTEFNLAERNGVHVHHIDGVKFNNHPANLKIKGEFKHRSDHTRERHEDSPEYVMALRAGHARYRANGGNEKSRANMTRLWAEGKFRRNTTRCAIEGCDTLSKAKGLCDLHYQRNKREKLRALRASVQQNHRVLAVLPLEVQADVWDITVDGTHNFALANGIFVHNSKDVADAVCGAIYLASRMPSLSKGRQFLMSKADLPRREIITL
jgi:hypothetical protein